MGKESLCTWAASRFSPRAMDIRDQSSTDGIQKSNHPKNIWLRATAIRPSSSGAIYGIKRSSLPPVLFATVGCIGFGIYGQYHNGPLLALRLLCVPAWLFLGMRFACSKALPHQDAEMVSEQDWVPDEAVSTFQDRRATDNGMVGLMWALAHLVPMLWFYYAFTRRTLLPYSLVIGASLALRIAQGWLNFSSSMWWILWVFTVLLSAWAGIQTVSRRALKMKICCHVVDLTIPESLPSHVVGVLA